MIWFITDRVQSSSFHSLQWWYGL